jgi:hypothetical protein
MLNWVGKRKLSPWENANGNPSIFRSSESTRPCTKVPRCQLVANLCRPRCHIVKAIVAHRRNSSIGGPPATDKPHHGVKGSCVRLGFAKWAKGEGLQSLHRRSTSPPRAPLLQTVDLRENSFWLIVAMRITFGPRYRLIFSTTLFGVARKTPGFGSRHFGHLDTRGCSPTCRSADDRFTSPGRKRRIKAENWSMQ